MSHRSLLILALMLLLALNHPPVGAQSAHQIERVSISSSGAQGNGISRNPSVSDNGRWIAFDSLSSNLVSGDTNGFEDVFVRDRVAGQTTLISIASNGTQGNGGSYTPAISGDGRWIAFMSDASNLVSGDTNNALDIFVHDRVTGQTTRVSVASNGVQADIYDASYAPSISKDGRWIAFHSLADHIVSGDTNELMDVFVHDRVTGQTTRVSVDSSGAQANNDSYDAFISGDGRWITFFSWASNLISNDINNRGDIFVHDRVTGQTTRVSETFNGTQANSDSYYPVISANGRRIAFVSWASNLVSGDTNNKGDVFVYDRITGQTARVSIASDGTQADEDPEYPGISADGLLVMFSSRASTLIPDDTNNKIDAFVHDQITGQTTRVSVASNGTQGNDDSYYTAISGDGQSVAFASQASMLINGDTNNSLDVFVADSGFSISSASARLVGLEAVQTIQDWRNSVRMVQDKRTIVRAHIQPTNDSEATNVRLVLYGERNGVALSGSPLIPQNGENYLAQPDAASRRNKLNGSPYFELPQTWLNGTVKLTVERTDGGQLDCGEAPPPSENDCSVTVTFQPVAPLEIRFIPIFWQDGLTTRIPTPSDFSKLANRLKAIFPIANLNYSIGTPHPFTPGLIQPLWLLDLQKINSELGLTRMLDGCGTDCNRIYYGVLKGPPGRWGGSSGFIFNNGVASGQMEDSAVGNRNLHAHEIAHVLGRDHAPYCGANAPPWVTFPYVWVNAATETVATIGPMGQDQTLIYGLDTSWPEADYSQISGPVVLDPQYAYELMSYCNSTYSWISDYTYEALIDAINQRSASPSFAVAAGGDLMDSTAGDQDYLIARGSVDTQANAATFEPFTFVSSPDAFPMPPSGVYTLEFLNASNGVLSTVPFELDTGSEGETDLGTFMIGIPADPAIKQARVVHNGVVIGSITASAHAPTVTITAPNGGETLDTTSFNIQWSASDPDGGDLTALIQYSWNNGLNWETVAVDLSGNSFSVDPVSLRGSSGGLFRVQVSDGFNTATDQSNATFNVTAKAPEITVHSPANNTYVQTGTSLRLLASAYDVEDGEIPGANFTWTSNIDGPLGTGNDLNVNLSVGMHTITVTAQDSDNNISSASMTVFGTNLLNDDFEWGHRVEFVPYSLTQDTSEATISADDAMPSCGVMVGGTVWYHFTAPADAVYQFDTFGSDYDTVLVVSSGPREAQIEQACSDNSGVPQSKLELTLTEGTEYHVMVAGNNGATGNLTFNVSSNAPILNVPDDYSATNNRQPTFTWSAANGAVSYEMQIDRSYPPASTPIYVEATNFTPVSPLYTTRYYWRVRAVRGDSSKTDWSATRVLTINALNNAVPLRNFFNTATPMLAWNTLSWATFYELEVYDNSALSGTPLFTNSGPDLWTLTVNLDDGIYYWRVRGVNNSGAGQWSTTETFSVDAP